MEEREQEETEATQDDAEGQSLRRGRDDEGGEDTEGQPFRHGRDDEGDDDVEGHTMRRG